MVLEFYGPLQMAHSPVHLTPAARARICATILRSEVRSCPPNNVDSAGGDEGRLHMWRVAWEGGGLAVYQVICPADQPGK